MLHSLQRLIPAVVDSQNFGSVLVPNTLSGKEWQTHIFFWCEFETYKILMSIQHTWVVSVQTWRFVTQVVWFCMHRTMKGHIWLLAARTWLLTGLEPAENSLPSCCVMVTQLLYSTGDAHHPNHANAEPCTVAFLICQGYRLSLSSEHGRPLPLPQKFNYIQRWLSMVIPPSLGIPWKNCTYGCVWK